MNKRIFVTRCKVVPHQTKYEAHLDTLPLWERLLTHLTRYRHGKTVNVAKPSDMLLACQQACQLPESRWGACCR